MILHGHVLDVLRALPEASVHTVVSSPPYWGLRDYQLPAVVWGGDPACVHEWGEERVERVITGGTGASTLHLYDNGLTPETTAAKVERSSVYASRGAFCDCGAWLGSLGLEPTPELYCAHMVEVFRAVRRVLRHDGTVWLNLGDCYVKGKPRAVERHRSSFRRDRKAREDEPHKAAPSLKPKDMVGVPWRVAFALQADGWWLRSDVIWHKPNPMPSSVTDRPTSAHEYLFLLAKSEQYFYDGEAIKEPVTGGAHARGNGLNPKADIPWGWDTGPGNHRDLKGRYPRPKQNASFSTAVTALVSSRNKRTVWTIATQPFSEAHFACYPEALVKPCILAGTSERGACSSCGAPWERVVCTERTFESGSGRAGNLPVGKGLPTDQVREDHDIRMGPTTATRTIGWTPTCLCPGQRGRTVPCTVLDPFGGSGTTVYVAESLGREGVAIELNPEYVKMAERRIASRGGQGVLPLT